MRQEFLRSLEEDKDKWTGSPSELLFRRFLFVEDFEGTKLADWMTHQRNFYVKVNSANLY
jgi:hypothetical protein